jgi:hypothetical protein
VAEYVPAVTAAVGVKVIVLPTDVAPRVTARPLANPLRVPVTPEVRNPAG